MDVSEIRQFDVDRADAAIGRADAGDLAGALTDWRPGLCDVDAEADALVAFAVRGGSSPPRLDGSDALFVSSMAAIRNFWGAPGSDLRSAHMVRRRVIGPLYDMLGECREPAEWSLAQTLNWLLMRRILPRRRAAVVVAMRDDGLHALEWIAHHRALGFDGVFIYTNDNADGSEHLLRALAGHGVVTLIENVLGPVRPEVKAFEHALHLLHDLRDYEWVLFLDSDEFFVPDAPGRGSVDAILDSVAGRLEAAPASAIIYPWLWFNSAMAFSRPPGLLIEAFQHATPHWLTKSFVQLRDVLSMRQQHIPDLAPGRRMVSSSFQPVDPARVWNKHAADYVGGRINHYWARSFEEFSVKKARGDALQLADNEYSREFRLFFDWNGPDSPATHHPPDQAFAAEVKAELAVLRSLEGVAALEADVRDGFRRLVARYDALGGLAAIYEAADPRARSPGPAASVH